MMDTMDEPGRTMVLGGSGLLGRELLRKLKFKGVPTGTYFSGLNRGDQSSEWIRLDISDMADVVSAVQTVNPAVIINAAYRQDNWNTTATGAANTATAAKQCGAHLVHISSDAVFSGADSQYTETALPDPVTPYGAAKAAAETAVRAILPSAAVVRTSLIIGDDGSSEHERRTNAATRGDGVLFRDDFRCPVHVSDLAAAVHELAHRRESGVFHAAGSDAISRYNLGRLIAIRDKIDPDKIEPANRTDLRNPGPVDVRLDSTATQSMLRTHLRGATEFLSLR